MICSNQTKLKIAMDGRSLTAKVPRGWDRYIVELAKQLVAADVDVTLLYRQREPIRISYVQQIGCSAVAVADKSGMHWEQVALPAWLKANQIDVYHAPAERGVPLWSPCPVVLTMHSVTEKSYQRLLDQQRLPGQISDYLPCSEPWLRKLRNRAYYAAQIRAANHILTPSEFCRQEVVDLLRIPAGKVTSTHLALPAAFLNEPKSDSQRSDLLQSLGIRRPYLLFVGGFEPHKNIAGLLDAYSLVRKVRPDIDLVLVGSKQCPHTVRAAIQNHGIADCVHTLVDVGDELLDIYDGAEAFTSLSWRETFCLPAIEALSRGKPVVLSQWGAGPEIAAEFGETVDPRNPNAAADKIIRLLTSVASSGQIAARIEYARHFSWKRTARMTQEVYQRLATSRGQFRS
ncbi:MAG: glycosyltransferase family 1 protein [Pirellulaceae bacterium]